MKSDPRLPQLEKALAQKRRLNTAINKIKIKKNFKKRKNKMLPVSLTKLIKKKNLGGLLLEITLSITGGWIQCRFLGRRGK